MTAIRRAALGALALLVLATIWTAIGGRPAPRLPVAHAPPGLPRDTFAAATSASTSTTSPATTSAATAHITLAGADPRPSAGPAAVRAVQALSRNSSASTSSALLRPGVCQPASVDVVAENDSAAEVQVLCAEQVTLGAAPVGITVAYQVSLGWDSGAWVAGVIW